MKVLYTSLLVALSALTLISCTSTIGNTIVSDTSQTENTDTIIRSKDTISITAVGDIMIGSAYPTEATLPRFDGLKSFENVAAFLKGDIVFGNLEGCFLNSGKSTKCKDTVGNSCFAFRMPERYAAIIQKAGFNLLSIANNHVGDFGVKGRERTVAILDSLNIKYAGLQSHPSVIFEKDSIKFAFCAFAPNENTVSINQLDSARSLVSNLKAQANIVIVSFHGGGEGAKFEHVPKKNEIFYNENRGDVYTFAHGVVDAGADVVLGHGPHVTRAFEVYRGKFIAYSLGNFCTYGMFNLSGPSGVAPLLQLKINVKGDFLFADVISVKQTKLRGLAVDTVHNAFKKIKLLTNMDFPENDFQFTGKGHIALKKP
jgi:poly-gamma-glutamate capsule biosynthesis protein CapA/YwtB (metallophosphatase superfamily)